MLEGQFYIVESLFRSDASLQARLRINPEHPIFQGHFPGQPVVPGVCMLQIVQELLDRGMGRASRLARADYLKFLTVLNPQDHLVVEVLLDFRVDMNHQIDVKASIISDKTVFFKCQGQFVPL